MWMDLACQVLTQQKLLEIRYNGVLRCVEVHAVAFTKLSRPIVRVWQISAVQTASALAGN